jgi:hypothetical protein
MLLGVLVQLQISMHISIFPLLGLLPDDGGPKSPGQKGKAPMTPGELSGLALGNNP